VRTSLAGYCRAGNRTLSEAEAYGTCRADDDALGGRLSTSPTATRAALVSAPDMAHAASNVPSSVMSEADPLLRSPPVLEEFVDVIFASPASTATLLDAVDDEHTPLLSKTRQEKSTPWYRRASPKL
jgi:hypothetical protein